MKKIYLTGILSLLFIFNINSQSFQTLKGKVVDVHSENVIEGVSIVLNNHSFVTKTDNFGIFLLENIPAGKYLIHISYKDYISKKLPITIKDDTLKNLGKIYLQKSISISEGNSIIALTAEDLMNDDERSSNYTAGIFQSSKDAYLKAASYNFSQAWFKIRGYDSSYGKVLMNGVEMNKLYDGRPQWSEWGGLNDVLRNQEFTTGIAAAENTFGNILGTTNFITRASAYRKGGKISIASTNRSYNTRLMATYATSFKNDWYLVVSASQRMAQEGYAEGASYKARSAFISAEKKFSPTQSLNLTAFFTPNKRGKSSPNTQEVYDLKGYRYNSYWGWQEGDQRNSRMKEIINPVIMLSHYYELENTTLKTSITYQNGHIGNSRLGYFNAPNPDPTYWKKLPSNFLRNSENPDYANAYIYEQEFIKNGQINWRELYEVNAVNETSLYYLYEDRVDDAQINVNSYLNTKISENINFNAGISFTNLTSKNYGNMLDLLGGNGFVDLDQYALGDARQNNLNNPDNLVIENEKFQYNYVIKGMNASVFAQMQATEKKFDYFTSFSLKTTNYQREGLFKNGTFPENSFGKGEKQSLLDVGIKAGFTYKLNGRNLINVNAAFLSNAPTIKTAFSNARVNNNITPNLTSEKIISSDVSYIFRSPKIQSRITAYYTKITDAVETSFFFAEGLLGDQADFVNEIITGVEKKHIGAELSFEYQFTPTMKLLVAGSVGQFTYNNNPQLYIQSESFTDENSNFGTAYLKNYHLSGTPQRGYSFGFEYRDPAYWFFQINANYLTNNYLDISPLLRTNNFYLDNDGVPFIDSNTGLQVTQEQIDELLIQEKFDAAFLLNAVGGKSWKVNDYYFGLFMVINNALGELFKTGGFEQSRKSNYLELKQDKQLEKPIFGPKYWYGNKASYYLNLYLRF